jgi:hypothetical protein
MIKHFKKIAALIALSSMSSMAFAQSSTCGGPSGALSMYASAVSSGFITGGSGSATYIQANHPECFASGATTSTIEINATSFTQATAVSRAIGSRFNLTSGGPLASAGTTGLSAGGMSDKMNVWGSIDQNNTDFSYTNAKIPPTITTGKNDVTTSVIGFDYSLSPQMVAGVSAAFDRANGSGASPGTLTSTHTDGYQIAPYIGYQLSKELALDASVGLGSGDFSNSGTVKARADRWFAAANLSYAKWMGNVQLTGKAGYLHGEEKYGNSTLAGVTTPNTASTNKIDQLRLGAQAGYWMNGVMPYVGLAYTSDFGRSSSAPGSNYQLGRDAFVWSLGANFISLSSKITGGVSYQVESNRTNSDNDVLSANVNFRF